MNILLGNIDPVDTFRVHLDAGEYLTLDVDPEPIRVGYEVLFPGLASSSLIISAADEVHGRRSPSALRESRTPEP